MADIVQRNYRSKQKINALNKQAKKKIVKKKQNRTRILNSVCVCGWNGIIFRFSYIFFGFGLNNF